MEQNSPWVSIWVRPRDTIARIVQENPNRSIWLLSAIYGFSSLLNSFQSASLGAALSPVTIFIIAAVLAPIWGMVWFSIWSWLVLATGKWFKGQGTFRSIRAAYAWSCVPLLLIVPLWILMIFLFGNQLFLNFPEGYLLGDKEIAILFLILIVKVVLAIWSFVIYLNALAQVQQFSILKAILNIVVSGIIAVGILVVLWVLVFYSFGLSVDTPKVAFQLGCEGTVLELLGRRL